MIDARKLVTHVFRSPVEGEWTERFTLAADHVLTHATAPGLALRLSDL